MGIFWVCMGEDIDDVLRNSLLASGGDSDWDTAWIFPGVPRNKGIA